MITKQVQPKNFYNDTLNQFTVNKNESRINNKNNEMSRQKKWLQRIEKKFDFTKDNNYYYRISCYTGCFPIVVIVILTKKGNYSYPRKKSWGEWFYWYNN